MHNKNFLNCKQVFIGGLQYPKKTKFIISSDIVVMRKQLNLIKKTLLMISSFH